MKDQILEFWDKLNSKVNVLFWVIVIFIGLDIWMGFLLYQEMQNEGLKPYPAIKGDFTGKIVVEAKERKPIKYATFDLPETYVLIYENNMFQNPNLNITDVGPGKIFKKREEYYDTGTDFYKFDEPEFKEEIKGYSLIGVVAGNGTTHGAALLKKGGGDEEIIFPPTREGKKILGENVKVKEVHPNYVILSAPGKKDTKYNLIFEKILNRWLKADHKDFISDEQQREHFKLPENENLNANKEDAFGIEEE